MRVPEQRGGVARVEHLAPVIEHEVDALAALDRTSGFSVATRPVAIRSILPIGAFLLARILCLAADPQHFGGTPLTTTQVSSRAASPMTEQSASVIALTMRAGTSSSSSRRSKTETSINGTSAPFRRLSTKSRRQGQASPQSPPLRQPRG